MNENLLKLLLQLSPRSEIENNVGDRVVELVAILLPAARRHHVRNSFDSSQ